MELTTPIMEESNWTSARRRSSAALRTTSLESESPSFFANSERSIFVFIVSFFSVCGVFGGNGNGSWCW